MPDSQVTQQVAASQGNLGERHAETQLDKTQLQERQRLSNNEEAEAPDDEVEEWNLSQDTHGLLGDEQASPGYDPEGDASAYSERVWGSYTASQTSGAHLGPVAGTDHTGNRRPVRHPASDGEPHARYGSPVRRRRLQHAETFRHLEDREVQDLFRTALDDVKWPPAINLDSWYLETKTNTWIMIGTMNVLGEQFLVSIPLNFWEVIEVNSSGSRTSSAASRPSQPNAVGSARAASRSPRRSGPRGAAA